MLTYEKIFGCDDTYHEVLEKSGIAGEPVKADVAYATNLVDGVQKHIDKIETGCGVLQNIDKIDETISEAAIGWTLERMSKVDLSILRNATYEILFDRNIPKAVAINEAVELAKIYCDEGSPRFINGCLGRIANSAAK